MERYTVRIDLGIAVVHHGIGFIKWISSREESFEIGRLFALAGRSQPRCQGLCGSIPLALIAIEFVELHGELAVD